MICVAMYGNGAGNLVQTKGEVILLDLIANY